MMLAGDHESYQYPVTPIYWPPVQQEFAKMSSEDGFAIGAMREGRGGAWIDFCGGIATIIHTRVTARVGNTEGLQSN